MCWTDCFLCCFSLQTGAIFVSSCMLALAGVGLLYTPFLPMSAEAPMGIILAYMLLLFVAFLIGLFGALSESKITLMIALPLGILAFIMWIWLTAPSFLKTDSSNCIGSRCGESHWLVPRQWEDDYEENPTPDEFTTPVSASRSLGNTQMVRNTMSSMNRSKVDDDDEYVEDDGGNLLSWKDIMVDKEDSEFEDKDRQLERKERKGLGPNNNINKQKLERLKVMEADGYAGTNVEITERNTSVENTFKSSERGENDKYSEQVITQKRDRADGAVQNFDSTATRRNEMLPWRNFHGNLLRKTRLRRSVHDAAGSRNLTDFPGLRRERFLNADVIGSGTIVDVKSNRLEDLDEIDGKTLDRVWAANVNFEQILNGIFQNDSNSSDKAETARHSSQIDISGLRDSNEDFSNKDISADEDSSSEEYKEDLSKDFPAKDSSERRDSNGNISEQRDLTKDILKKDISEQKDMAEDFSYSLERELNGKRNDTPDFLGILRAVNTTPISFSFATSEANKSAHRFLGTVNHQKAIVVSYRAQQAASLLRLTWVASVIMALMYLAMFVFALATLGMYLQSLLFEGRKNSLKKSCSRLTDIDLDCLVL